MLSKVELLQAVEERADSRAEIARVLSLAPARITEMYKGERDISFEEARKLSIHYKLDSSSGSFDLSTISGELGIAFIPEVDISFGMGGGTVLEETAQRGLVPFKTDWLRGLYSGAVDKLVVARGEGDSMQPTILDGDLVLIDTSQNDIRSQDRIWAVAWGDLGMIKRVRRNPGGTYDLCSDNPAVSPVNAADGEMHVIGRVIWIGRRM